MSAIIVGLRGVSHADNHAKLRSLRLDETDLRLIESVLNGMKILSGDVYELERTDARHSLIMHKGNNAKSGA